MNNIFITSFLGILNIILLYFLKYKLLDFISRILQNLNKPLDYIASFIEKSNVSIVRLNYRQKTLNFTLVFFALILVFSEFSTLSEAIKGATDDVMEGISIGGVQIGWNVFSAISYIAISTLLGFIALELLDSKRFLQGILFNDSSSKHKTITKVSKYIASFLFILLIVLALLQGYLALYRYDELSPNTASDALKSYRFFIQSFYFLLGFLTPVIAAMAFTSLDIFLSIVFSFIVVIIRFVQKILSVIFYALETLIMIISSPMDKILEFFGLYQASNINQINVYTATPVKRLAPLQNNNIIYKENRKEIYNNYNYGVSFKNKIQFICENPNFSFDYPSNKIGFNKDMDLKNITDFIKKEYYVTNNLSINFYSLNFEGVLSEIDEDTKLINILKQIDYIAVEIDEYKNIYQQSV